MHALFVVLALQAPAPSAPPPVRVWLGPAAASASGDRVRVYVQTAAEGHLVVLHARSDGQVEVLYPADPARDPFVNPGTYEIRGQDSRDGVAASGPQGRGTVVAALSPDPIWFDEFVHRSMWDATTLTGVGAGGDPEGALTEIVQRMLGDGSFSYDLVTYDVAPPPAPNVVTAPEPSPESTGGCVDCFYPRVDYLVYPYGMNSLGYSYSYGYADVPLRPYVDHRGIGHAGRGLYGAFRDPPAIAVYSTQRGNALAPISLRQGNVARPTSVVAPRRRTPTAVAAPVPATFAARAVPLVARTRSVGAPAPAARRSELLVRYTNAPRSRSAVSVASSPSATMGVAAARTRVVARAGSKAGDRCARSSCRSAGSAHGARAPFHPRAERPARERLGGSRGTSDHSGRRRIGAWRGAGRCTHRRVSALG